MADLVRHIHTSPHDNPGDMDRDTAVALAAFILNRNGAPSGKSSAFHRCERRSQDPVHERQAQIGTCQDW